MKQRFRLITLPALFALMFLAASPAHAQGPGPGNGGQVVFGQNITVESGETYNGDLVLFGGNVRIEKDAALNGDLFLTGGNLLSHGRVNGDIVVVGGQITLGETAVVAGDVVTIGGQIQRAEGARIEGEVVNNIAPTIRIPNGRVPPSVPFVEAPRVVNVSFNPFMQLARVFGSSVLVAFLGMLAALFFQERLNRVSQAVIVQPLMTSSIGLLTIVGLLVAGITIILLPFALLGLIPLGFAWLFGVVALGQEIGERFAKALRQEWAPVLTAGFGTFLLMLVVSSIQAMNDFLPFMACVTWIIPVAIGLLAIGAVVVTRFGARPVQSPALIAYRPPSDAGESPPASQP
jgi:cytoskeletal protein CcmA (bactofilin family)